MVKKKTNKSVLLVVLLFAILLVGLYFLLTKVVFVDKSPLMIKDLENIEVKGLSKELLELTPRYMGISITGIDCLEGNTYCGVSFFNEEGKGAIYVSENIFADHYSNEELVCLLKIYTPDGRPIDFNSGAYLELIYDGGNKIRVKLPNEEIIGGSFLYYNIYMDGSISINEDYPMPYY